MSAGLRRAIVLMATLMVAASVSAVALRPTVKIADHGPKVNLEQIVPTRFGDWRVDTSIVPLVPAPDVQAQLDKIYNQTLARTYVNSRGQRVMLSIAYGGDQSDAMQVHLPEVCYAAQGFQVRKDGETVLTVTGREIPVRRVVATLGNRVEPISYWITIGDQVVNSGIRRKLTQIRFGMAGSIPDGMLVRFSSIGRDAAEAYALHDGFIRELILATGSVEQERIAGRSKS